MPLSNRSEGHDREVCKDVAARKSSLVGTGAAIGGANIATSVAPTVESVGLAKKKKEEATTMGWHFATQIETDDEHVSMRQSKNKDMMV